MWCERVWRWSYGRMCYWVTPRSELWESCGQSKGRSRSFEWKEVYLSCCELPGYLFAVSISNIDVYQQIPQISEAHAGSDVFGLQTTATKTEDGKHWIINGTKKWITNGT